MSIPRLILASPASGQGKTTVCVALTRLLRQRGLTVAPFKAGPDYIDPTHHHRAAARPSRNLDGWLLSHEALHSLFHRATTGEHAADVALIEGMMGLFDGRSASSEAGSTAEVAKLLRVPVVLVLDASAAARTTAALVLGLNGFDPDLRLAGVILNRLGGEAHYELCREAIEAVGVPVLGWLPDDPRLAIPERHLGLVLAGEHGIDLERLAEVAGASLRVDELLEIARAAPPLPVPATPLRATRVEPAPLIAVARDAAFDFYYQDNLDLLAELGAEVRHFSPLEDETLPPETGAIYLGGGYPELHAERLFVNLGMRRAIRDFAAAGRPVYAECGGLMYLSRELIDGSGARHRMVGLVPARSRLRERPTIGYREVEALRDSPIAAAGEVLRGHEFHFSVLDSEPETPAYRRRGGSEIEGWVTGPCGNVLASYIHLHFGADPRIAERLVRAAAAPARTPRS